MIDKPDIYNGIPQNGGGKPPAITNPPKVSGKAPTSGVNPVNTSKVAKMIGKATGGKRVKRIGQMVKKGAPEYNAQGKFLRNAPQGM